MTDSHVIADTTFDLAPPTEQQRRDLAADLDDEERRVLLEHGTEAPFCGLFNEAKATCVDARLGAREIFRSGVARGRVLTCVRPLMRLTRRRPGWESVDQVQFRPTRLTRLSQSWFS